MAPVCDLILSSCRRREKNSVDSSKSSSVIVRSKHTLRGPEVGDPLLFGIEIEGNGVNPVKSLPAPKHYIIIINV